MFIEHDPQIPKIFHGSIYNHIITGIVSLQHILTLAIKKIPLRSMSTLKLAFNTQHKGPKGLENEKHKSAISAH